MNDECESGNQIVVADSVLPVDVDAALEWWNAYQRLTEELLSPDDYQETNNGTFKKKSAWRKYATAFQLSIKVTEREIIRDENGRVVTAEVSVIAKSKDGKREVPGWASCSIWDKSHEFDKVDKFGKITCKGPCNGRPHFTHPEHDIPSTAHTRAVNRAISDMIGAGEVSADEMGLATVKSNNVNQTKSTMKKRTQPNESLKNNMKARKPSEKTPKGIDPNTVRDAETPESAYDDEIDMSGNDNETKKWKEMSKKNPALKKVCDSVNKSGLEICEVNINEEATDMNKAKKLTDAEYNTVMVCLGKMPA